MQNVKLCRGVDGDANCGYDAQQAASSKQQAASSKQQAASSEPEVIASAVQYIEGTDTEKARYEALLWESGLFVMTLQ